MNASSVKAFGAVEYGFSSIKIAAILGFILLGSVVVWGGSHPKYGVHLYTAGSGFLPHGWWGMWVAVIISIFSYLSVEMIAVAAGEAEDPERAVKQAFRATIVRLLVFYLLSLALILAIVPWEKVGEGSSPFVTVMQVLGIPYAADILNFVVIVAALSAMNSQLYITTRMMFSLARGGDAPPALGKLSRNGVPLNALMLSSVGIAVATLLYVLYPKDAFILMISLSMFGAMFVWMMIFVTHLFFRHKYLAAGNPPLAFRMKLFPYTTLVGLVLMLAAMVTTLFTAEFNMTLKFGIPFLVVLVVLFKFVRKSHAPFDDAM